MERDEDSKIIFDEKLGYAVYGKTIGSAWIRSVECVLKNGRYEPDESRNRVALQSFRLRSDTQILSDTIIDRYAKKQNIDTFVSLVFEKDVMEDFDVVKNFSSGAKSYKVRIEEGDMLDFVVDRLTKIPESKKAVMVFPTYEDYKQVKESPYNDYLPCIVSLQFRLRPDEGGVRKLNTILNMRSWNIDQKGAGDLTAVVMLNHEVCERLNKTLNTTVEPGIIDVFVTDIHIYQNTIEEADKVVAKYNTDLVGNLETSASKSSVIKKSAAIIIKDRSVLYFLEEGYPYYLLPGGKMKMGESEETTLERELIEEISQEVVIEEKLGVVRGKGVGKEGPKLNDVELTLFKVSTPEKMTLSGEIIDKAYVTYKDLHTFPMTPIGIKTVEFLHDKGLID